MVSVYKSLDNYRYFLKKTVSFFSYISKLTLTRNYPKRGGIYFGAFFCLNIETLVLGSRSRFIGFTPKNDQRFWSIGVLECWTKPTLGFKVDKSLHYSITPADSRARERPLTTPLGVLIACDPRGPKSLFGILVMSSGPLTNEPKFP